MTTEKNKIAKEGLVFIYGLLLVSLIGFIFYYPLGCLVFSFALFTIYFFRNPKRITPTPQDLIIAPADGTVIFTGESTEHNFLNKKMKRITIFMSPFNVHVNRAPANGEVKNSVHYSGKFLAAFDERASLENERSAIHLTTDQGDDIVFVQIAGWFARRIISYPKIGETLKKGDIFGLIKFGSRMDIFLPENYELAVGDKQKTYAGETVLAIKRS